VTVTSTTTTTTGTTTSTTSTIAGLATPETDECVAKGRKVVATFTHRPVGKVAMKRGIAHSGAAQCTFRSGGLVVTVSVDGSSNPYAFVQRDAIEEAQIFSGQRLTPAPESILHEGLTAYWFPAERQFETTEGVNLITTTVARWPGVKKTRWEHMASVLSRRYLGRNRPDLIHGPAPG
jgi:hypothetical protein